MARVRRPIQRVGKGRDELRCPACGYDLRELEGSTCPECGRAFSWAEVMFPPRRKGGFEAEGTVRSYLRGQLAMLRPARFWSDLRKVPFRKGRLAIHAVLGAALPSMAILFSLVCMYGMLALPYGRTGNINYYDWARFWQDVPPAWISATAFWAATWLALLGGTLATMWAGGARLSQAKVGWPAAARLAVYGFDPGLLAAGVACWYLFVCTLGCFSLRLEGTLMPVGAAIPVLWVGLSLARLHQGFRVYAGIRPVLPTLLAWAAATVLSFAMFVGTLIALAGMMGWWRHL